MKFKFYPVKRNGEYAKTPVYTDSLDKEFCRIYLLENDLQDIRYGRVQSLYEVYIRLLQKLEQKDKTSTDQIRIFQLNIGHSGISDEELGRVLCIKLSEYRAKVLDPAIQKINKLLQELEKCYEEDHDKINYAAFQMRKDLDEYVNLIEKRNALSSGKLIRLDNPEESNENNHYYSNIVEDVEAITPKDIWKM